RCLRQNRAERVLAVRVMRRYGKYPSFAVSHGSACYCNDTILFVAKTGFWKMIWVMLYVFMQ
ncbi:hypothetical protein, partial [Salmonella sp. AM040]